MFNNLFKKIDLFFHNVEKYGTARQAKDTNKIGRMRFACLINKTRHTLATRKTYCFSTAIMVSRKRLNVMFTRTVHCPVVFLFSCTTFTIQNTHARGGFAMMLMLQVPSLARAPPRPWEETK
jgi:hypothetical protein